MEWINLLFSKTISKSILWVLKYEIILRMQSWALRQPIIFKQFIAFDIDSYCVEWWTHFQTYVFRWLSRDSKKLIHKTLFCLEKRHCLVHLLFPIYINDVWNAFLGQLIALPKYNRKAQTSAKVLGQIKHLERIL